MAVSKEVSSLENEMLEFKEALAEWKSMPSTLHIDDSASVSGMRHCSYHFIRVLMFGRATQERPLVDCGFARAVR